MKRYLFLFSQFFKIALFVVGGGLAMLPVIEQVFVKQNNLLTDEDFVEMVAMTQTIPGLIAINSAIFVGFKVCGTVGALVSVVGVLLPSLIIISLLAMFFPLLNMQNETLLVAFDCVRASVAGIFTVMFVRMFRKIVINRYVLSLVILLTIMLFVQVKTVFIILSALCLGLIYMVIEQKCKKANRMIE